MGQMGPEKRYKRTKKQEDFLSKLPDDVVGDILSRISTKEAVRTSVLAKKWRNLWTLIHNLDFHNSKRFDEMTGDASSFKSFLNRVPNLLKSKDIGTLRLHWIALNLADLLCVYSCIQYAIDHNVAQLDLSLKLKDGTRVKLPSNISTCKSLEVLNLESDFLLQIPTTVECFVNLKILHVSAEHPDCESLSKVFCNCPVLEELSFIRELKVSEDDGMIFHILAPSLKKLSIELKVVDDFERCSIDKFVIRAPKLESLEIVDQTLACFKIDEMPLPAILKAKVYFGIALLRCKPVTPYEANRAVEILRGIRKAKFLVVSDCTAACLNHAFDDNFPIFPFLVHLELGIDSCFGWKLLPYFLENARELEVLVLEKESIWIHNYMLGEEDFDGEYVEEVGFGWIAPNHIPHCLLYHVKEIKMNSLWGSEDEVEVVKYLLGKGKVLKKMTIGFSHFALKQELNEKMITEFRKGSKECEVEFL